MTTQHPEIITAPFTIWIAPVGTAFPAMGTAPAAPWRLLGTNGARGYGESGVVLASSQQWVSPPPPAGQTATTATALESEELRVRLDLIDLTLEQFALTMGNAGVTTVAPGPGTPGFRRMGLAIGPGNADEFALLVRGPSPYNEDMPAQFELPRACQVGSPQPVFSGGSATRLAVEFKLLPDPSATSEAERFGRLMAQDAGALAPVFLVAPFISGGAIVGGTLTGEIGTIEGGSATSQQLLRLGDPDEVVANPYLLSEADLGDSFAFEVTATGPGGETVATSAVVGPVALGTTSLAFASVRTPPENGEDKTAAGQNGGLYIPTSDNLFTVTTLRDTPMFVGPSAIAVVGRFPTKVYDGTRRQPTLLGNLRARQTSNRMINISLVSGAETQFPSEVDRFLVRLMGEVAGGSVSFLSAVPTDISRAFPIVVFDGTNFRCDVRDLVTGALIAGTPVAKPGAWAGINRMTGDIGIGISGNSTASTLPGAFPFDGSDLTGNRAIPFARAEFGGVLFLDDDGTNTEWEAFAQGGDPLTIWPGQVRAWYPLTSAGALDLAPRKNRASNVTVGNLVQLGTLLPGSTLRRQTPAKYLLVKDAIDPAVVNLRRGVWTGTYRQTLTMAGQTAGQNIEALFFRADGGITKNWSTVGTTVANGDVVINATLPPGIMRARFRIAGGGDECELNTDISVGLGLLVNGQSQCRYTFGLAIDEQGTDTPLNLQFNPGVGERTFVLSETNASGLMKPAIIRAARTPGLVGDGIVEFANAIGAAVDWPIHLIDVSVSGTTLEDTLEDGGSPDVRDMADIYAVTNLLRGRNATDKAVLTAWFQFWHSAGTLENYAQTYMPPMLDGTPTGAISPSDYFRSGVAIDPDFLFMHGEPNRYLSPTATTDPARVGDPTDTHLTRRNLRLQEANYDYTLAAPLDVQRLDTNQFTHPDPDQLLGAPLVARFAAKSLLYALGLPGGWAGPVEVTAAQFTSGARTAIDVTFTGPAGLALGVLNGGAVSGFEVAADYTGFTAAITGPGTVRLTKTSGSWLAGAQLTLKTGGPADYGAGFDEAAYVNGALINTADGMLVRGTNGPVVVAEA